MSNEGCPCNSLTIRKAASPPPNTAPLLCVQLHPQRCKPPHAQVPWRAREIVALLLSLPPPREGNRSLVLRGLRLFAHFLPGCDEVARHRPGLVYRPVVVGRTHERTPPSIRLNAPSLRLPIIVYIPYSTRAYPQYQSECIPTHAHIVHIPHSANSRISVQAKGGDRLMYVDTLVN
jgi:hypothetical protein